jgi:DNA-binding NarL/FixJ family response regulator
MKELRLGCRFPLFVHEYVYEGSNQMSNQGLLRSFERDNCNLTDRQTQVVDLLRSGFSNKEIARRLSISEGTVKLHLHAIYRKLNISTRGKLIASFIGRKPDERQND